MITVKLYGLLRIESGIKEKRLEAGNVKEVLEILSECGIPGKDLAGCVILINLLDDCAVLYGGVLNSEFVHSY